MIVGTAGHIDHGKTSLVAALTGVDCDRLAEEKARGITIELGFAYWPRPAGTIGFVDVPGHERLVHTMLAGATGIDLVLLVVAADDGVMPQTREHLAILDLLGLDRGIVALTKADLVGPARLAEVSAEVRAVLAGTGLEGAAILPVSAVTGAGLPDLTAALDAAAATITPRAAGRFRLGIDRVFTLKGAGTVVTGTIVAGTVRPGDQLCVTPAGLPVRVRSLHAQGRVAEAAQAGQRAALALTGSGVSVEAVPRGEMLIDPTLLAPTRRIDVSLRVLAGERHPLGQWAAVRLHLAAAEITGRVVLLSADEIAPGEEGLAQLVLDAPLSAAVADRFVLRDISATRTIAGGRVIDLAPPERRRRSPERLTELALIRDAEPLVALQGVLEGPRGWVDPGLWFRDRAATAAAEAAALAALDLVTLTAGPARAAFLPMGWARLAGEIGARLDTLHETQPEAPGLGQERLRLALRPRLPAPLFTAALNRLAAEGAVALDRGWLRRPWHQVRLTAEEEALWSRLLPHLGGAVRFRPPRLRDIATAEGLNEASLRRLFRLAARRGDVEELAQDHFFLWDTICEMAGIARSLSAEAPDGRFPVIAFRDRLDNGRKVAIQILEHFDRQGLTMRRGDLRRINPHRAALYSTPRGTPAGDGSAGGVSSPVGRPDFKSGGGRETPSGRFDSCLLRQGPDGPPAAGQSPEGSPS